MIRSLLENGKQEYPYTLDIIGGNDIEIYKLLYLHRISEFKAEILDVILRDVSLHFIEFMYENRSDKSVDPFQFYRGDLFSFLIEQDSFNKLQFFIKVRESECLRNRAISSLQQYRRCRIYIQELSKDFTLDTIALMLILIPQ
ncbi:hypothetical protein PPL_00862 [Heterostelium album PN500]|uniref:Uncharacterized protein n=1 Tax=Heterostelium pallidum (strain ATCC 26659 / Pp 5 / PN500) TaxID=670386 RepID=D3AYU3_HETP5|nr:hypothetical protein PPL_00862 [Heterostelium album PN500]EFA85633.1 hypothetical protein PPL_00862 [Heterostelium album PN500]|eukprot:XP_020437740.1 hypothetical protein PPL_00862 [Heterostelium album PN500]